tara:strand:+ start:896 stop:2056 length:1161 start_codon:yes stop_codon:yes gene_type:complete
MGKRGPSIDEKMMGPEPNFHGVTFKNASEIKLAFSKSCHWFNYFFDAKKNVSVILKFAENEMGFKKKDITALKKLSDSRLNQGIGSIVRLHNVGFDLTIIGEDTPIGINYLVRLKNKFNELLKEGKSIAQEKKTQAKNVVVIPVQERTRRKVMETMHADFDKMVVDKWMDGIFEPKEIIFPTYSLLQLHKIKGAGIKIFEEKVREEYNPVSDAYNKTCDQAVEAYSHIKKGDLRKMMKVMEKIFDDIDRTRANAKVTRLPRAKTKKTSDDQVKNLNYMKEDVDAKLMSINPVMIPSKNCLFVYNTKNRMLYRYKNESVSGFEVRGSTIYNWNEDSICMRLRKPDDILPDILTKTGNQIDKLLSSLTTKVSKPTGRINKDCILLRVL